MQDHKKILELIEKGNEVKITEGEKDSLYNMFVGYFEAGDYAHAAKIIETLCLIDTMNTMYLKSLASCYQQQKEYLSAFVYYNYVFIIDQDEFCLYYMANCLIELQEFEQALYQIDKLLLITKHEPLLNKAKILSKYIKKQLKLDDAPVDLKSDEVKNNNKSSK